MSQDETNPPGMAHPLSRRRFLGGAGGSLLAAATAAAALPARAEAPARAVGRPMPDITGEMPTEPARRIGYAVVGLGNYALNQILPSFGECRHSRLVALVSGDRGKSERVATQYGVDPGGLYGYDDLDRIADNGEIDVVYVVTPPFLHADQSIRASRAGKHVLCEKPMAIDAAECQRMIDAAAQAERLLMIGYRCHYEPHNLEAVRMIRDGELGTVRAIHTENATTIDPASPSGEWRLQRALAGGGSLFDVGIYGVNGARYLTGEEPVEVRASTHTPAEGFGDVEDVVSWQMRFPSGITSSGSTAYSVSANRFGVAGTDGYLDFQPATSYHGHELRVRGDNGVRQVQVPPGPVQFALQLDHMSEAILRGTPVRSPGQEGMQDIRILRAIYAAAESGRPVPIDWDYASRGA